MDARKFRCVQFFLNSDANRLEQIKVELLEFTKDHTCTWVTIVAWGGQDPKKNRTNPSYPTSRRLHAAVDEGELRRTAEQGAERFMTKWIAAEKVRAERNGKDQGKDIPNQAGSYWFARHS